MQHLVKMDATIQRAQQAISRANADVEAASTIFEDANGAYEEAKNATEQLKSSLAPSEEEKRKRTELVEKSNEEMRNIIVKSCPGGKRSGLTIIRRNSVIYSKICFLQQAVYLL